MKNSFLTLWILPVFLFSCPAGATPVCEDAIVQQGAPRFDDEVNVKIMALSRLRLKLDQAQANGDSSLAFSALSRDFQKKVDQFAKLLKSKNLMTRPQLISRIRDNIIRLQQQDTKKQHPVDERRASEKKAIDSASRPPNYSFLESKPFENMPSSPRFFEYSSSLNAVIYSSGRDVQKFELSSASTTKLWSEVHLILSEKNHENQFWILKSGGNLQLVDAATEQILSEIKLDESVFPNGQTDGNLRQMDFSPDGTKVAIRTLWEVYVFDLQSGRPISKIKFPQQLVGLAFIDEHQLVFSDQLSVIQWDFVAQSVRKVDISNSSQTQINALVISKDLSLMTATTPQHFFTFKTETLEMVTQASAQSKTYVTKALSHSEVHYIFLAGEGGFSNYGFFLQGDMQGSIFNFNDLYISEYASGETGKKRIQNIAFSSNSKKAIVLTRSPINLSWSIDVWNHD